MLTFFDEDISEAAMLIFRDSGDLTKTNLLKRLRGSWPKVIPLTL